MNYLEIAAWVVGVWTIGGFLFLVYHTHCYEHRLPENDIIERIAMVFWIIPVVTVMMFFYVMWLILSYPFSKTSRAALK